MLRDVFVSHASEDHAVAEQVCELLEQRGLRCWIAPRDVGAGAEWDEAILDAIERCRAYLLILSARANQSSFVKNELNRAFSCGKAIITLRIEDVLPGRSLELYLARHHWTDAFPPPLEPRVEQLASSLTQLLNPSTDDSAEAPPAAMAYAPAPVHKPIIAPTAAAKTTATAKAAAGARVWMMAFAVAVAAAAALAVPALRYLRETPPPPPPETRLDIVTPTTDQPTAFALSPDGRQIVYVATGDGASRLWLRSLASTTAQPLAGTEGAIHSFWSPDSRSIGFIAGSALKRLDLGGGAPRILASAIAGRNGTWGADNVILITSGPAHPLMRVSAASGAATVATTLGPQQRSHRAPQFLPDGRRFLCYVLGTVPETTGIYLGSLDGSAPTRLTGADSAGVYLPGWLLWTRAGTLVAQRLDLAKAALSGEPVTLADGVATDGSNRSALSVAATGLVAYRTGGAGLRQLTWFDRTGTARGSVGEPDGSFTLPRVSPDGRRVAVARTVQGNTDLWLLDGARTSRVTFDAAPDSYPLWSPDGARIVFLSTRAGAADLYQKLTNGTGAEELLVGSDQTKIPFSWSADGRFLLYTVNNPNSGDDLGILPMMGERKPSVFLQTPFRESGPVFSPDGRWVAYLSNESGRAEIYLRPFVAPAAAGPAAAAGTTANSGGQWQVSTGGGIYPLWRPDGRELYYLNPEGAMVAAPIRVTGNTLEPGAPVRLFATRIVGGGTHQGQGRQYDVTPDGRFLINTQLDGASAPITLIQNWNPEVQ